MSISKIKSNSIEGGIDVELGDVNATGTITGTAFVGVFAPGTKMVFHQTNAPTGWTKDTTHDNKALRVVSGTAGSGGSVAFTTAFASQAVSGTVANHTLTTAQMPNHGHNIRGGAGSIVGMTNGTQAMGATALQQNSSGVVLNAGSSNAHNHGFTGTAINLAVQYVDLIIATKD
jgi:hypothetical protein